MKPCLRYCLGTSQRTDNCIIFFIQNIVAVRTQKDQYNSRSCHLSPSGKTASFFLLFYRVAVGIKALRLRRPVLLPLPVFRLFTAVLSIQLLKKLPEIRVLSQWMFFHVTPPYLPDIGHSSPEKYIRGL